MVRRRPARAHLLAVIALASAAVVGCGSDDSEGKSAAPPRSTTTEPASPDTEAQSTTTVAPKTARQALVARLADEWQDRALADQVVAGLDPAAIDGFADEVPIAEIATTPRLSYRPDTAPAEDIDSLVIYAFGYHEGPDGTRLPGPVNEELAELAQGFLADHPVPVFAQQEVAQLLTAADAPDVTSIDPEVGPDGQLVYLSTAGVADQAVAKAEDADIDLGTAGVLCFADHVGRCVLTSEGAGITAVVPEGVGLPSTYDPQSAQPWTRGRETYLRTDLASRLAG